MDTSKEYTEMCSKAVDVQGLWNPKPGDCFSIKRAFVHKTYLVAAKPTEQGVYAIWHTIQPGNAPYFFDEDELNWLPRQDQLQYIVPNHLKSSGYCMNLIHLANDFYKKERILFNKCSSIEQVWLMITMKTRFQKTWTGKDWIKC